MATPLRVLIVEDSADDAELLLRELRRGGYEPTAERVETAQVMSTALARQPWDAILADYSLPQFSGFAALKLVQEKSLDIPFIIVSGTIGEGTAVAAMRAGAHDYLMKGNLVRLTAAVERELREAAMRREHRRMERLKDDLLDVMAHEFRTPLSVLLEGVSQLTDGSVGQATPDQRPVLTMMADNLQRLTTLSEKALSAAQWLVNKVEFKLTEVDVAEVVKTVRAHFNPVAEAKGIRFQMQAPNRTVPGVADAAWLKEALGQLVENAIQATPSGGEVILSCATTADGGQVCVQDTGRGIPAAELQALFERFQWVGDVNERRTGGLGLGLFIAKAIAEAHGGTLTAESMVGKGTRMTLHLPKGKRRILIIDDSDSDAALLKREVEKTRTYEALVAHSGQQGLDLIQQARPNLVLLDINMPEMDGIETLKRIKTLAPELPVAMVTGVWEEAEAKRTFQAGAYDYITKPVDVAYLKTVLLVKLL